MRFLAITFQVKEQSQKITARRYLNLFCCPQIGLPAAFMLLCVVLTIRADHCEKAEMIFQFLGITREPSPDGSRVMSYSFAVLSGKTAVHCSANFEKFAFL